MKTKNPLNCEEYENCKDRDCENPEMYPFSKKVCLALKELVQKGILEEQEVVKCGKGYARLMRVK